MGPVREVIKPNYGVQYKEDVTAGGGANARIAGETYYASPGRTMRRDELESKQQNERNSKVQDYQKSRMGDIERGLSINEEMVESKASSFKLRKDGRHSP